MTKLAEVELIYSVLVGVLGASKQQTHSVRLISLFFFFFLFCVIYSVIRSGSQLTEENEEL